MFKSKTPNPQALPEISTEITEAPATPEAGLNRIEQFLKAKAAHQHRFLGKDTPKHSHMTHAKLKERVRRRP